MRSMSEVELTVELMAFHPKVFDHASNLCISDIGPIELV